MSAVEKREHLARLAKAELVVTVRQREMNEATQAAIDARTREDAAKSALSAARMALADEQAAPVIARLPEDLREAVAGLALNLSRNQWAALSRRGLAERKETGGWGSRTYYRLTNDGDRVRGALQRAAKVVAS